MNAIRAIAKYLSSYSKSEWDFGDYPVMTWRNPNARQPDVAYGAGIINWSTMVGHGATPDEALAALKQGFRVYKENADHLPRPGSKVPLRFAATDEIGRYEAIAVDFFSKVLGMDYHEGFYSDGSILQYFEPPDDEAAARRMREEIIHRTRELYDIDIAAIYDEPLHQIFKEIKNKKDSQPSAGGDGKPAPRP